MNKFIRMKVDQYKDRFIDFERQKETLPDHVVYGYVYWIHQEWDIGQINLSDYRKLIKLDILKV